MPKKFWTRLVVMSSLLATAVMADKPDYVGADASIYLQDATVRKVFHDEKGFEDELKANQIVLDFGVPTGAVGADRAAKEITYKRQVGSLYDIMEAGVTGQEADAYYDKFEELVEILAALEKKGLVHGDPHLKNILVDDKGNLLLGDWGRMALKSHGKKAFEEASRKQALQIDRAMWYLSEY